MRTEIQEWLMGSGDSDQTEERCIVISYEPDDDSDVDTSGFCAMACRDDNRALAAFVADFGKTAPMSIVHTSWGGHASVEIALDELEATLKDEEANHED
jgi:hypothetical protein